MFFDICESFCTKLSKSIKGQTQFQQIFCRTRRQFLFELVNQWEKIWRKWKQPSHQVHQFVNWLQGTRIWIFKFPMINQKKLDTNFFQRKLKLLSTEEKIFSFTYLASCIELFLQRTEQNVKNSTHSLSSKTAKKSQLSVKKQRVHKVVLYDKTERLSYEKISKWV